MTLSDHLGLWLPGAPEPPPPLPGKVTLRLTGARRPVRIRTVDHHGKPVAHVWVTGFPRFGQVYVWTHTGSLAPDVRELLPGSPRDVQVVMLAEMYKKDEGFSLLRPRGKLHTAIFPFSRYDRIPTPFPDLI